MKDRLIEQVSNSKMVKYIFCDYYDTIIHRRVHPLKPFKIWAKELKYVLQLETSVNELFNLRRFVMGSLCKSLNISESEVSYEMVMNEVYQKLDSTNKPPYDTFVKTSYEADYNAEASVQYINQKTINSLKELKKKGYVLYCVSDFHADEDMILRLMQFHGIDCIFDKVFVSASQNASKENEGLLFKKILEKEGISPEEVLMVGDNPISDVANAVLHGIESHYLKRNGYKIRQKFQFLFFVFKNKLDDLRASF